jgi:predicted DNA-binding transcriptional regulator YafY
LERIARIDLAIRGGRWPNASTLARELEVTPRTIQRDLLFLRDRLKAPLEFDPARNGYRYTSPDYRLPFFRLTQGELVALFLAERLLRQYRGTPYEADLERAFARLTEALPEEVSIDLAELAQTLSVTPTVTAAQDAETFEALAAAVAGRRRVEIDYWTASRNEVTRREVDPYHLTIIDGDWYLIGYCHLRRCVRMFTVLRVRALRETGEAFERPGDFQVERYLAGSFRAVRGEGHYRVVLRFTPPAAGRVAEKVWHPSQRTEWAADGGLLLRFEVTDLVEVKRWVLFWGAECQVMEPDELRAEVVEEVRRMQEVYEEATAGG